MKNADAMLKDIVKKVDTSGDGKIQYEGGFIPRKDKNDRRGGPALENWMLNRYCKPEFRHFVEQTERQLLLLFRSIDHDKNGRLDKEELHAAFQRAGLSVPNRRLSGFFDEIDMNNDGYISFDEWRYVHSLPGFPFFFPG